MSRIYQSGKPNAFVFCGLTEPVGLREGDLWYDETTNKLKVLNDVGFIEVGTHVKLDDVALPDDNTDLNASASRHGLLPKLSNNADEFFCGDGTWAVPAGGGGGGTARESLVGQWTQSITKTNIGASFVDIYNQTNADGKSVQVDTNGKTQVRLIVNWNKIGTGTHTVQVLEVGTANVLVTLNVVSGRNTSALTNIPAFAANSVKFYKLQGKSTVAADDPIFEAASLYVK